MVCYDFTSKVESQGVAAAYLKFKGIPTSTRSLITLVSYPTHFPNSSFLIFKLSVLRKVSVFHSFYYNLRGPEFRDVLILDARQLHKAGYRPLPSDKPLWRLPPCRRLEICPSKPENLHHSISHKIYVSSSLLRMTGLRLDFGGWSSSIIYYRQVVSPLSDEGDYANKLGPQLPSHLGCASGCHQISDAGEFSKYCQQYPH